MSKWLQIHVNRLHTPRTAEQYGCDYIVIFYESIVFSPKYEFISRHGPIVGQVIEMGNCEQNEAAGYDWCEIQASAMRINKFIIME